MKFFIHMFECFYSQFVKNTQSEDLIVFTRSGSGVMALAITPPGVFGDLPVFGKSSNRGSRPLFGSDRSAQQGNTIRSGDGINYAPHIH